ncbi:MAG: hypothetical protein ACNA7W_00175 [Pseudomonadales bacterium]
MIYLIGKMFVYLLLSLGLGVGAGWLLRNIQATLREETLERQLMEARSRLPQMETALRKQEDRLGGLRGELRARDEALADHAEQLAARDRAVAELERNCAELNKRLAAADRVGGAASTVAADDELELHPGDPEVAQARGPSANQASAGGASAGGASAGGASAAAAEPAIAARTDHVPGHGSASSDPGTELAQARQALEAERQRIEGLMRERELQNASLRALEQQLELAREAAAAAPLAARVVNG